MTRWLVALFTLWVPAIVLAAPPTQEQQWEETLERVVRAVVSIKVVSPRDFDTESTGSSYGTGFVVDAERGILLTNRHIVNLGPVVAEAVFYDNEEVELEPIYRDPVHDFGFFRFDPAAVRHMELVELPLAPERAVVGRSIRVVGNDAGSKLSILDGTLSRLDMNAPYYGSNTHNDFNTFYLQAASSTSGGSSGSPVVDQLGNVIGLNAGSKTRAATAYYLPLDRVVPALEALRAGAPVPRGTLATLFTHTSYDELVRLGLDPATEAATRARFPEATGMLVVREVVGDGPGHGELQPGDVLLSVQGEPLVSFVPLEAALDAHVGRSVALEVDRGGQRISFQLEVADLHAITPSSYLEAGGAVINEVSYATARNHGVAMGQPYVAAAGYAFANAGIGKGAIIDAVDGVATPDLTALEDALASVEDGARVTVRFRYVTYPRRQRVAVVTMNRRWHMMQRCTRNADGKWPCVASPPPPAAQPPQPATTRLVLPDDRVAARVAPSLVVVDFDIPYRTQGVSSTQFKGAGLIVDAERGLVVVDRDTVPVSLGDAVLTVGGAVRIPARVRWVHPVHNLAVLQYDPKLLGQTPVVAAVLAPTPLSPGQRLWQVGLSSNQEVVSRESSIDRIRPINLGTSATPRFRDASLDVVSLTESTASIGGVLADKRGRVLALWSSFWDPGDNERRFRGMPIEVVEMMVAPLRQGRDPGWGWLEAEVAPISLADARDRGLPEAWADRLLDHDSKRRDVLAVVRRTFGSSAAEVLEDGDIILAANGRVLTRALELERACQGPDRLQLTVFRDGEVLQRDVAMRTYDGVDLDRAVSWAGVVLHEPHREVASQQGLAPAGVYVAWYWYGSPAHRYGLRPTRRIVAVDDVPVEDLDGFLAAVADKTDREPVKLTLVDLDDKRKVLTMKLDLAFWPTREFVRGAAGWRPR